jgi:hypothetical protein
LDPSAASDVPGARAADPPAGRGGRDRGRVDIVSLCARGRLTGGIAPGPRRHTIRRIRMRDHRTIIGPWPSFFSAPRLHRSVTID